LGFILNTGTGKKGEHWISLYVDLLNNYIFFYNSFGNNLDKNSIYNFIINVIINWME
jgi:hypothetical protein